MAFQLPLTFAAFDLGRTGFYAVQQVEIAFDFFVDQWPIASCPIENLTIT